jgi:putative ABC transport system ATP-binding protein
VIGGSFVAKAYICYSKSCLQESYARAARFCASSQPTRAFGQKTKRQLKAEVRPVVAKQPKTSTAKGSRTAPATASAIAVEAQDLHRVYHMGNVEVPALHGVDLQVRRGEFIVILGVSGSGKSTLLHLLGGLDRPTQGRVFIEAQDLSQLSDNQLAEVRLRKIGFVFQFFNLMPQLTAQANVELPLYIAEVPAKKAQARAEELLAMVGLAERTTHRPSELSGGEQQRVAIARALANDPKIILADEPTGNLDTANGAEVIQLLRKINQSQGQTVIVVGHDLRLTTVADRVIEMRDGRFVGERLQQGGGRQP